MGKFGNRKLPKFLPDRETRYGMNPAGDKPAGRKRLKELGLLQPNLNAVKIVKVYTSNADDAAEIREAGYKVRKWDYGEFIKVITPWEEEQLIHFEQEGQVEWVEMGEGGVDLVGYHDGFKYSVPATVIALGSRDDYEVSHVWEREITVETDPEGENQPSVNSQNLTRTSIERAERQDPNFNQTVTGWILNTWENGPKQPISIYAYRVKFNVSDPLSQINRKTGDITTDEGEIVPIDDVSSVQIYQWTNRELNLSIPTSWGNIAWYAYRDQSKGKATESFDSFVNECWSPMPESYVPGLSDNAKMAIKRICEEVLIHEAHSHDMSENVDQTYESYLNECGQYMTECMMQAAQKLKV